MSDGTYTNLDLDTAEALLVASGQPDQAKAMRQMTQGWRNMWQGEFGQSFVDAFDRVVANHIKPLIGGQADILAVTEETAQEVKKLSLQVGDMGETLTQTISRVSDVEEVVSDHTAQIAQHGRAISAVQLDVDTLRAEVRTKFEAIEARISTLHKEQELLRTVLAAHPQPEALRNANR